MISRLANMLAYLPQTTLLALGKALYLSDPQTLTEKGLSEGDNEVVQRIFEAIDDILEHDIGPDWLGGLEDKEGEGVPGRVIEALEEVVANPRPTETPFLKLVRNLR